MTGTAGLAAATGMLTAPARAATRTTGALQTALDRIAATAAVGVLAEVRDGRRTWSGAAGRSRLDTAQPAVARARFRAGSITKSFVATVVLQLAGEGRLALDDTVRRWLPGLLPDDARVTVRQLLQHTSGLEDYLDSPRFQELAATPAGILRLSHRTWTSRELLALVDGLPLRFEPGTDWWYSNTGYVLLGMLVERITGTGFATEIHRRLLRPLGLLGTEAPGTDPHIRGTHLHGYLEVDGEPVDITGFNPSLADAAGGIVSSTADLNTFFRALIGGRLLRPAEQRQLLLAHHTPRGYDYGLGMASIVLPGGTRLWGHRGDFPGFYAESWTTADGERALTVAATPWGAGGHKPAIGDLIRTVFESAR